MMATRAGKCASLLGRVALISGASSGIGRGTAVHLASLGMRLSLTGRNEAALMETVQMCKSAGALEVLPVTGDLSLETDCKTVMENTLQNYKELHVLVNNAGILEKGTVEDTSLEAYDRMMNINVRSVFHMTSLAVPHLIATKGSIVNVSSVNGMRAFAGVLAYCMSKSALDQFTRCIALELAPKGVRVNSVNPGVVVSNLQKRGGLDDDQYSKFLEHSKTTHALGRFGHSEEVAKAIAFLASDDSSFITGAQLPVDGGRHAMCPR